MRPSTVNLWRAQKDAATTKRNVQRFCFGKQKELVVLCQNNVSILIVEVTRRIVVDNAFLFHVSTEVLYSQRLADALQKSWFAQSYYCGKKNATQYHTHRRGQSSDDREYNMARWIKTQSATT